MPGAEGMNLGASAPTGMNSTAPAAAPVGMNMGASVAQPTATTTNATASTEGSPVFGGRSRKSRRSALKKKKFTGGSLNFKSKKNKLVAKSKQLLSNTKKNYNRLKSKVGSRIGSLTWKSTQRNILTAPQRLAKKLSGKVGNKLGKLSKGLLNKGKAAYAKYKKNKTKKTALTALENPRNVNRKQQAVTSYVENSGNFGNIYGILNNELNNPIEKLKKGTKWTEENKKVFNAKSNANYRLEQALSGFHNEQLIEEAKQILPQRIANYENQKRRGFKKNNPFDPDPKKPDLMNIYDELEEKQKEYKKKNPGYINRHSYMLQKERELENAKASYKASLTRAERAALMKKTPSLKTILKETGNVANNVSLNTPGSTKPIKTSFEPVPFIPSLANKARLYTLPMNNNNNNPSLPPPAPEYTEYN
ncbi:MAG: hypothetical protein EBU82_10125 [Flavobacteriia bacterium]|nr:hypothetical protein [Flavobacteriia bacterium]